MCNCLVAYTPYPASGTVLISMRHLFNSKLGCLVRNKFRRMVDSSGIFMIGSLPSPKDVCCNDRKCANTSRNRSDNISLVKDGTVDDDGI